MRSAMVSGHPHMEIDRLEKCRATIDWLAVDITLLPGGRAGQCAVFDWREVATWFTDWCIGGLSLVLKGFHTVTETAGMPATRLLSDTVGGLLRDYVVTGNIVTGVRRVDWLIAVLLLLLESVLVGWGPPVVPGLGPLLLQLPVPLLSLGHTKKF